MNPEITIPVASWTNYIGEHTSVTVDCSIANSPLLPGDENPQDKISAETCYVISQENGYVEHVIFSVSADAGGELLPSYASRHASSIERVIYDAYNQGGEPVKFVATFEPPLPDPYADEEIESDVHETVANGGKPVKRTMTIRRVEPESAE